MINRRHDYPWSRNERIPRVVHSHHGSVLALLSLCVAVQSRSPRSSRLSHARIVIATKVVNPLTPKRQDRRPRYAGNVIKDCYLATMENLQLLIKTHCMCPSTQQRETSVVTIKNQKSVNAFKMSSIVSPPGSTFSFAPSSVFSTQLTPTPSLNIDDASIKVWGIPNFGPAPISTTIVTVTETRSPSSANGDKESGISLDDTLTVDTISHASVTSQTSEEITAAQTGAHSHTAAQPAATTSTAIPDSPHGDSGEPEGKEDPGEQAGGLLDRHQAAVAAGSVVAVLGVMVVGSLGVRYLNPQSSSWLHPNCQPSALFPTKKQVAHSPSSDSLGSGRESA